MRESETACLCELQAWYSQPHHTNRDICRVWGARGMLREFYRHGVRRTSPIRGKGNQVVIDHIIEFTYQLSAMHTEAMLDYECEDIRD